MTTHITYEQYSQLIHFNASEDVLISLLDHIRIDPSSDVIQNCISNPYWAAMNAGSGKYSKLVMAMLNKKCCFTCINGTMIGNNMTPLILCVSNEITIGPVRYLLQHGADITKQDIYGKDVIDYAMRRGDKTILSLLFRQCNLGHSLIQKKDTVQFGFREILHYFLKRETNATKRNKIIDDTFKWVLEFNNSDRALFAMIFRYYKIDTTYDICDNIKTVDDDVVTKTSELSETFADEEWEYYNHLRNSLFARLYDERDMHLDDFCTFFNSLSNTNSETRSKNITSKESLQFRNSQYEIWEKAFDFKEQIKKILHEDTVIFENTKGTAVMSSNYAAILSTIPTCFEFQRQVNKIIDKEILKKQKHDKWVSEWLKILEQLIEL